MEENNSKKFNSAKEIIDYIKNSTSNSEDMVYKELELGKETVNIVYSEATSDGNFIADFIIRSLRYLFNENINEKIEKKENDSNVIEKVNTEKKRKGNLQEKIKEKKEEDLNSNENNFANILENLDKNLGAGKIKKLDINNEDIFYYIFSGFTCIMYDKEVFAVESRASLDRSITEPAIENTIKGPKDCFIENYSKNIGLVRKRLRTEKLVLEEQKVGRRTKTKVGI